MTREETPADRYPRWAVPAITAAIFAAIYGLYAIGQVTLYRAILESWGLGPYDFPFVDIHGVLSSLECWRMGVDVYVSNPCDVLGRVFFYSPPLLWASAFNLGTSDTQIAGLILDGMFLLSLAALPAARGRFGLMLMLLGTLSTMTLFAVERANIDVLIFALAALVGMFLPLVSATRFLAYPLIGMAALLKFYPAVLLALGLRERPRIFAGIAAVSVAVLALFVAAYHDQLHGVAANVPGGKYFTDMFGAPNLPYGLAVLFPALFRSLRPEALRIAFSLVAALAAAALAAWPGLRAACRHLPKSEAAFLEIGAWLVVGCFIAGQSIGYRGIFLLFVLPGLWRLATGGSGGVLPWLFRAALGLILFLMWGEFIRRLVYDLVPGQGQFLFWLGRELAWWAVISLLGGLMAAFALESETFRGLAAAPAPRRRLLRDTP
jgi:hypothetical protein